MYRKSPIPIPTLSQTSQVILIRVHFINLFYFWESINLTEIDHMGQCGIRGKSWKPTPKEGRILVVDPLGSILMGGNIVQELGDIVGALFMCHAL